MRLLMHLCTFVYSSSSRCLTSSAVHPGPAGISVVSFQPWYERNKAYAHFNGTPRAWPVAAHSPPSGGGLQAEYVCDKLNWN